MFALDLRKRESEYLQQKIGLLDERTWLSYRHVWLVDFLDETDVNLVFENMWWGAADGPSGNGPGSGDLLTVTGTGTIDIDPVLTAPCVIAVPEPGAVVSLLTGFVALLGLGRRRRK